MLASREMQVRSGEPFRQRYQMTVFNTFSKINTNLSDDRFCRHGAAVSPARESLRITARDQSMRTALAGGTKY